LDLAAMQRDSRGWVKLFVMFSSFTMAYGNRQRFSYNAWRNGKLSTFEYGWALWLEAILPAMASTLLYSLITTGEPPEPEDLAKDVFMWNLAGLPFVRDLAGFAIKTVPGQTSVIRSPAFIGAEMMGKVGRGLFETGEEFFVDGDVDEKTLDRLTWNIASLASYYLRVPVSQVYDRMMKGMEQIEDGEGTPLNLLIPDRREH
jgi:hypothetical protein